jgi:hypothetical protein
MAKLPPKPTLPRGLVEQLHAELAGLPQVVERLRAKRPPCKKAKPSRRKLRERIEEAVRELWPRGVPARDPNRKLLRHLRAKRRLNASDTTLLRALGRRRDPQEKPAK